MRWLYAKLGRHYVRLALAVQYQGSHLVVLGGVMLLTLFVDVSTHDLVRIIVVTQILCAIENALALAVTFRLVRPADQWLRGDRAPENATRAWRALAGLPLDFIRYRGPLPIALNLIPVSAYITWQLGYGVLSFFVFLAGACVVLLYGVLLRFFAIEIITQPVLEQISRDLPADAELARTTVPLKARLLLALPAINVVGGVVVSGLSSDSKSLTSLGVGVAAAILVAFTISFELSLLLANSIIAPLRDLRRGTELVADGDYTVRVPVLGSDETGRLASSFNEMVAGLQEREKLREAFGAYVDPQLAERVIAEGTQLAGEEIEVSVLFLDIRDFTAFAERASAREVVGQLNDFFECVVPVLTKHGGHANKFVGDGLLAVFGAPDRLCDHADRAVAAALEIVEIVGERYGGELLIGIGVNSGPVVAGTVGGGGRVEFTVIGDPVNTASRVEEVTRITGDRILVTEATCALLERDVGGFVERPLMELKGKTEAVRLHAPAVTAATPELRVARGAGQPGGT
jgi:class 3 adenylate cyclase